MMFCPLTIKSLRITWAKYILLNLRVGCCSILDDLSQVVLEIEDTTESNTSASVLDLPLSIGRTVNFTILFLINVTISIFI